MARDIIPENEVPAGEAENYPLHIIAQFSHNEPQERQKKYRAHATVWNTVVALSNRGESSEELLRALPDLDHPPVHLNIVRGAAEGGRQWSISFLSAP
jgi:hypothetical protein